MIDRFLIVGLGSIGQRHLRNLRHLSPDAWIGVLRRPSSGQAEAADADAVFENIEAALACEPQAAILANPSPFHIGVGKLLAEAGIHLFIEKPFSHDLQGAEELVIQCAKKNLTLAVGYNLRFVPSLRAARNAIQSGRIGKVFTSRAEAGQYLPDWRKGTDYRYGVSARAELGGGALLELSHEIDYTIWTFGLPHRVKGIMRQTGELDIDTEDLVEILFEYDEPSRLISIHLDMVRRRPIRQFRAVGTEGIVCWDGIANTAELEHFTQPKVIALDFEVLSDSNQTYLEELRDFVSCVHLGNQPVCSGMDGLAVMKVVAAIRESAHNGGIRVHSPDRTSA